MLWVKLLLATLTSHIRALLQIPVAPLLIQFSAKVPGKVTEDGSPVGYPVGVPVSRFCIGPDLADEVIWGVNH